MELAEGGDVIDAGIGPGIRKHHEPVADKYPASRVEICRSDCDHRVRHLEEVLFAQFHIPRRLRTTHPHMTHRHIAIRTQMSAEPDLALRNLRSELAEFVT